ncbi:MAG: UDP-galactopyranose mutase [Alphaproteobacteria bacterium]|nr:UDP-galactopyranose mutase [Alphaproteobacteria bacterium]
MYDFLIVGSGFFGSVCAYELNKIEKKCLIIDKRRHLGGNVYTENCDGIQVHKYGPHIFHTNDKDIWNYINQFAEFNNYIHNITTISHGKMYNMPFNMNTFNQIWNTKTPIEAQNKLAEQIKNHKNTPPNNLEEQALALVGKDIYELLIKGYTEKQWGCKATELPSFIIKRLPLRFTYNNNYFSDRYQGIPIGGYTQIFEKLTRNIEVKLDTDYFENRLYFNSIADKIIYTGKIDEFFDYNLGTLEYRSLRFDTERLEIENFQGNAQVNYNDTEIPFTRIVEHKHFEFGTQNFTIITKEYPQNWDKTKEAFYPINNPLNQNLFKKYVELSQNHKQVYFGGRLAEYRYYDMHQVIASALTFLKKIKQSEIV